MEKRAKILAMFFLALVMISTAAGEIIFVDANANGLNDGSGWSDAFNDLQDALYFALPGDEIRVAQGVYYPGGPLLPTQASNPNPADGATSVSRTSDLSWTAGLDATSHDVYFGMTSPCMFQGNQSDTTFDPGTMADYTTYYWRIDEVNNLGKTTTGTVWSFTTISGGGPSLSPPPLGDSNVQGTELCAVPRMGTFQLKNSVLIKGGYAGLGATDPNARDIELYETILSGDLNGDDVDVNDPTDLLDEPSRAENSYHVVTGSGTDETAIMDGFTITGGNANFMYMPGSGGGPHGDGGGMHNSSGSPTLINCTFTNNSAYTGGGMYNGGSSPTLTNCIFSNNSASWQGCGMFNGRSSPTLTNCIFSNNSASCNGSGMYNGGSSPTLTNCIFSNNSAYNGGGMFNIQSNPTVTNSTFSNNSAYNGGGMFNDDSSPTLTNCIVWGNIDSGGVDESAQIHMYNETPAINYCCIQGWTGALGGIGNIDADPHFVDSNNNDYHLLADSPCIDAGDPNYVAEPNETDLDGRPRVIGGRIDMGAYESPIFAEVRIVPRAINLASKGKWITCYIWLPEGYDVADIDLCYLLLEYEIEPEQLWLDEEEQLALAKFSREEVQGVLEVGDIELTIIGQLTNGTMFEGTDVITVIDKGRHKPEK